MITENDVKLAAKKWAIDTKKKFPHLSEPEFIAGAKWAINKLDPLCMEGAQLIEKLLAENERLRTVIVAALSVSEPDDNDALFLVLEILKKEYPCTTPST